MVRTLAIGFVAGALSLLIFHQLGFWVANELQYTRVPLYSLRQVRPLSVPAILSSAFWAGLWGVAASCLVPRLPPPGDGVLGWMVFAAVVPTLANWFIVLPLKGAPVGGGFYTRAIVVGLLVYAL